MTPIAATLLFLAWLWPFPPVQVEGEPNDSAAQATPLARNRAGQPDFLTSRSADGVVQRARLEPGDVDYYSFAARAGDVLLVSIFERGRGAFADPVLAVAGPGDDEPVAFDDDGGPGFLPRLRVPIDRTGVWTIAVGGFGDEELDGGDHEQRFAYELVVAVAGGAGFRAEKDVRGGNDTAHRAEPLLVAPERAVVVSGRLEPGDVDRFLIPLPLRGVLTASLYDDAGGAFNDSRLQLRDLRGRLIAEDDDSGPGFLSNLALDGRPGRGPLVLVVSGFDPDPRDGRGHEQRFAYRLVVSAGKSRR